MAPRAASFAEIEIIKSCILIAQEKGTMTCRGGEGEDCWGEFEYEGSGLRVDSTLFFYAPAVGFFTLKVEENGILVFAAAGCINILTVSAVQVFCHIHGQWKEKVISW